MGRSGNTTEAAIRALKMASFMVSTRDNGKEHGNYYIVIGLNWGYIGVVYGLS